MKKLGQALRDRAESPSFCGFCSEPVPFFHSHGVGWLLWRGDSYFSNDAKHQRSPRMKPAGQMRPMLQWKTAAQAFTAERLGPPSETMFTVTV